MTTRPRCRPRLPLMLLTALILPLFLSSSCGGGGGGNGQVAPPVVNAETRWDTMDWDSGEWE